MFVFFKKWFEMAKNDKKIFDFSLKNIAEWLTVVKSGAIIEAS